VTQLGEQPVDVVVPDVEGLGDVPVHFDDALALSVLRSAMYETDLIPVLPYYISELAAGRQFDSVAGLILERSGDEGFSDGEALSVNCREEIAFLPSDHFETLAEEYPLLAPVVTLQTPEVGCEVWDVGAADRVIDTPVVSDVPTLLLVGEFDPVHPEAAARSIAEGLSASTVVVIPGVGHGTAFAGECPGSLIAAFLAEPEAPLDTSCAGAMPPVAWLVV
jgi:pimeloyl-ACP methyl ester carboxylesterase